MGVEVRSEVEVQWSVDVLIGGGVEWFLRWLLIIDVFEGSVIEIVAEYVDYFFGDYF